MDCSMPGFPVLHFLLENSQTHVHWVSDATQPSHPLLPSSPLAAGSFPVSCLFASGGQSIEASTSVLPLNIQGWFLRISVELTGLICLQSEGLSKNFLQHHSSKASILWHSAFFMVKLSHPYMTTGKILALTRWTFVGKVMSLLFNILSRLVIAFLPKSKRLLISWLQSLTAVILEPKKMKSATVFHFFPIYLPWSDRTRCHDLSFLNVEF